MSKTDIDTIQAVAHCDGFGWKFCTGRSIRLRDVRRLVKRGLLQDAGLAAAVDGDGWRIQPERWKESWELTEAGCKEVARLKEEQHAEIEGWALERAEVSS
jgi:hypothetical protein